MKNDFSVNGWKEREKRTGKGYHLFVFFVVLSSFDFFPLLRAGFGEGQTKKRIKKEERRAKNRWLFIINFPIIFLRGGKKGLNDNILQKSMCMCMCMCMCMRRWVLCGIPCKRRVN